MNLVKLLANSVANYPTSEAVVFSGERVSYRELWENITAISNWLLQNDINKGDRVALLLENSPEYIASYYGVLAVGGVVVALNTGVKSQDLANWIQHSKARFLVGDASHSEFDSLCETIDTSVLVLATGNKINKLNSDIKINIWASLSAANIPLSTLADELGDDDLAAIIYTSGTTGEPKGVMQTHGNLYHNMTSILHYLKLSNTDRVLNVLPFYYSYGNSVLHTHLAVGGCLVLENNLLYPHKVIEKLVEEKATGFSGVPSTFALLLSRVDLTNYDFSNLRYMTQAGGAMSPSHIQRLRQAIPHMQLFIMYGQTEATARISYLPPERIDEKLGSVGIPVNDVQVEIRDSQGNKLPSGQEGEIYVHGKNLMKGYWMNPEATSQVLVAGWLKTGDLGYMDRDGYIFLLGRSSDMIKSGANRISPKEIEETIQQLDGVAEVAVVGTPDELLGEAIYAFIVTTPDSDLSKMNVMAHCKKNLAIYKLPKKVIFVEELPKTASGKIRRFLLTSGTTDTEGRNE